MLMQPDKQTKALLELADYIENLPPYSFDITLWCKCIAGHVAKRAGTQHRSGNDAMRFAQEQLGLSECQAIMLFAPTDPPDGGNVARKTQYEAARTLRHLAVTGEVVWS